MRKSVSNKKGAVSLGMTFLIFIIVALVVLVVLSGALRNYVIGGLHYFSILVGKLGGQTQSTGVTTTSFVAYQCSSSSGCSPFQNITPYNSTFWYVYFNGRNLSAVLPSHISFTSSQGNYSFVVYNVSAGNALFCSNLSFHSGLTTAGEATVVYYSQSFC